MLKNLFRLLKLTGLSLVMLISTGEVVFAAADTNCKQQQDKCDQTGCARLEEGKAINKCNDLGWNSWATDADTKHTNLRACYEGCMIDQEIGRKDNVKGCRFTPCTEPAPARKGGGGRLL